jgi:hypothetical protein
MPALWWNFLISQGWCFILLTCACPGAPMVLSAWQVLGLQRMTLFFQLSCRPASGLWSINLIVVFPLLCIFTSCHSWNDDVLLKWSEKNSFQISLNTLTVLNGLLKQRYREYASYSLIFPQNTVTFLVIWGNFLNHVKQGANIAGTIIFKVGTLNTIANIPISVWSVSSILRIIQ